MMRQQFAGQVASSDPKHRMSWVVFVPPKKVSVVCHSTLTLRSTAVTSCCLCTVLQADRSRKVTQKKLSLPTHYSATVPSPVCALLYTNKVPRSSQRDPQELDLFRQRSPSCEQNSHPSNGTIPLELRALHSTSCWVSPQVVLSAISLIQCASPKQQQIEIVLRL